LGNVIETIPWYKFSKLLFADPISQHCSVHFSLGQMTSTALLDAERNPSPGPPVVSLDDDDVDSGGSDGVRSNLRGRDTGDAMLDDLEFVHSGGGAGARCFSAFCARYSALPCVPKDRRRRRICEGATVLTLLTAGAVFLILGLAGVFDPLPTPRPRNIIFMVSDGMGPTSVTMARECRRGVAWGGDVLPFEKLLVGTSRTYSASSLVTDSAAGATAYSCAKKTYNGAIGVDPSRVPCGTLLEAAKAQRDMLTGLVVTSTVSHATPGSFAAHAVHRDMQDFIAEQEIDLGVDVIFGGGKKYFTQRADGRDLVRKAKDKGYTFVDSASAFRGISSATNESLPVLGLFSLSHMDFEIDRDPLDQPSLAEMTQKALDLLSASAEEDINSERGFFLLIEGSRIDMAAHINDPVRVRFDLKRFRLVFSPTSIFPPDFFFIFI
jgi:alkaline phosphatase